METTIVKVMQENSPDDPKPLVLGKLNLRNGDFSDPTKHGKDVAAIISALIQAYSTFDEGTIRISYETRHEGVNM